MIPETKEDVLKLAEIEPTDKLLKAMDDYAKIYFNTEMKLQSLINCIVGILLGLIISCIFIKLWSSI